MASSTSRAILVAALTVSCAPPTDWRDLRSIEELKETFNADQGNVRLVVLLSPT